MTTSLPNHSGTKCPKCDKTNFEFVEDFPTKSQFKMYYMRCTSCKIFLQSLPFHNTNTLIEKLQEDISKIKTVLKIYP